MNPSKPIFILFYLLLFGTATPLILGFLNFLHPLLDSFSHFRVHLLWMVLPIFFILMLLHKKIYRYIYLVLLVLFSFYLYTISQPFTPSKIASDKTHTLKHMQFNLSFRNQQMQEVSEYIQNNPMDIITLQEVTKEQQEVLEALKVDGFAMELSRDFPFLGQRKGDYPYQAYCNFRSVGAVAVLSKHPFESEAVCLDGFIWAKVRIDEQPINIISTHLYWSYPHQQPKQVEKLLPILEGISSPLIISGDFNAAPWSHTVKEMARASHTNIVEGLRWSIDLSKQIPLLPFMQLPLDHILISKEFEVKSIKVEEGLGSDHLPIMSEITYE